MGGRQGARPGRAWLLGAATLALVWSLVIGLGPGGPVQVAEQLDDPAFDPPKELAMERRAEREIRGKIEMLIATADAQDPAMCLKLFAEKWRRTRPECPLIMEGHPPLELATIDMIDVFGPRARVEFTGMVRGRKKVNWEANLILETRKWMFDHLVYHRHGARR